MYLHNGAAIPAKQALKAWLCIEAFMLKIMCYTLWPTIDKSNENGEFNLIFSYRW
jgi:hypothetical protein